MKSAPKVGSLVFVPKSENSAWTGLAAVTVTATNPEKHEHFWNIVSVRMLTGQLVGTVGGFDWRKLRAVTIRKFTPTRRA